MKGQTVQPTRKVKVESKAAGSKKLKIVGGEPKLEGNSKKGKSRSAIVQRAYAGIPEFNDLKKRSGLSDETLAQLLDISPRTIQNKRTVKSLFDLSLTERLLNLDKLFTLGILVLGKPEQFASWLNEPAYGLDYEVPITLLKSPGGLDIVMNELTAIKYGDSV